MKHRTQTNSREDPEIGQFTLLGGCVFILFVLAPSGGITAYLILWLTPWLLELPFLPARLCIPFAAVGTAVPLTAFFVLCAYSRLARRLFFRPTDDNEPDSLP
ncbi:MAG TPA: hypothetical protein VE980_18965 [Pyrinomonadaceae bacterium]|nr:hypothetical protein [Pyrinomonadaceae bacterium]